MKGLTKTQKCIVLASLFWLIIAFFLAYNGRRHNEYFEPRNFLILILPIILYWSGVWLFGFGYIQKHLNTIKLRVKSLKIPNITSKLGRSNRQQYIFAFFGMVIIGSAISFYQDNKFIEKIDNVIKIQTQYTQECKESSNNIIFSSLSPECKRLNIEGSSLKYSAVKNYASSKNWTFLSYAIIFSFLIIRRSHDLNRAGIIPSLLFISHLLISLYLFNVFPSEFNISIQAAKRFAILQQQLDNISNVVLAIFGLYNLFVLLTKKGTVGENRYGKDPLAP